MYLKTEGAYGKSCRDRGDLFEGLDIWKDEKYREIQGNISGNLFKFCGDKALINGDVELIKRGVNPSNIHHYGFTFKGKEVLIDGNRKDAS